MSMGLGLARLKNDNCNPDYVGGDQDSKIESLSSGNINIDYSSQLQSYSDGKN